MMATKMNQQTGMNLQSYAFVFLERVNDIDKKHFNYREDFKAVPLGKGRSFPIRTVYSTLANMSNDQQNGDFGEEEKQSKLNPNAINDKVKELIFAA